MKTTRRKESPASCAPLKELLLLVHTAGSCAHPYEKSRWSPEWSVYSHKYQGTTMPTFLGENSFIITQVFGIPRLQFLWFNRAFQNFVCLLIHAFVKVKWVSTFVVLTSQILQFLTSVTQHHIVLLTPQCIEVHIVVSPFAVSVFSDALSLHHFLSSTFDFLSIHSLAILNTFRNVFTSHLQASAFTFPQNCQRRGESFFSSISIRYSGSGALNQFSKPLRVQSGRV